MVLRDKGRKGTHGTIAPNATGRVWETPSPQNSIENCITVDLPAGVKTVSPYVLYNIVSGFQIA